MRACLYSEALLLRIIMYGDANDPTQRTRLSSIRPRLASEVRLSVAVFWETCGECFAGKNVNFAGGKPCLVKCYGVKANKQKDHVNKKVARRRKNV